MIIILIIIIIIILIKRAKRPFEYLHNYYISYLNFTINSILIKQKEIRNDSINHKTILLTILCDRPGEGSSEKKC